MELIKVLIGSRAAKTHNESSDYDYRTVYIDPTEDLFRIGQAKVFKKIKDNMQDTVGWEVARFLELATKSNPNILEIFRGEIQSMRPGWGDRLIELFPAVWSSAGVYNGCLGYSKSQQTKFLKEPSQSKKANKYLTAYIRTLYMGSQILRNGDFDLDLTGSPVYDDAKRFKEGDYEFGEALQVCHEWEQELTDAYDDNPNKETDIDTVNDFLVDLRKSFL